MLTKKESLLLDLIKSRFIKYNQFPSYSELAVELGYKSKNSITVLVQKLIEKKKLVKDRKGGFRLSDPINSLSGEQTVEIPLLGEVACGIPIFAEENFEAYYSVSTKFAPESHGYFLLRAIGDSMNVGANGKEPIHQGDMVLIKAQSTADSGDWVLALIDDEATIKELQIKRNHILLVPHSTNENHKPTILEKSFEIQGVVKKVFCDLT